MTATMTAILTRRNVLTAAAAVAAAGWTPSLGRAEAKPAGAKPVAPSFPGGDPERARMIVGASHFDAGRVKELLDEDRALALASWDWGFGDWESALGAASHMGNREIARLLLDHGARANLFTWAMMDKIDAVRAVCEASPGIQSVRGPHGITLLRHAVIGKAERVEAYLRELGGADVGETSLELGDDQAETYLGEYGFTGDGGAPFIVEKNSRGGIGMLRQGGTHRKLRRTGEHEFSPSGAPHVTVRFEVREGRAAGLTIDRGGPLVAARRAGS